MTEHDALFEALVDLAEGRLDAGAREALLARVAASAELRARLREIEELLAAMREGDAGDAPDLWRERAARRAVPRSWLRPMHGEHVAEVAFDSQHMSMAGVRSSHTDGRQLVLRAERLEIEMYVTPREGDDPFALTGQILPAEGADVSLAGCTVAFSSGAGESVPVAVSEHGEFAFRERPPGPFTLHVRGADWVVRTPPLTI